MEATRWSCTTLSTGGKCHNLRERIIAGNDIRFDAITNANGIVLAWKTLKDQPRFYREAERFLRAKKKKLQGRDRPCSIAATEDEAEMEEYSESVEHASALESEEDPTTKGQTVFHSPVS